MCTILITVLTLVIIYICRHKIKKISDKNMKRLRFFIIVIILLNMILYRGSYIYYRVYNIKVHLSLYYCHLINYFFVFCLYINKKTLYRIVYTLIWVGAFWTVLFPDISGGIDCFIFYSSFISHNMILCFVTFIVVANNVELSIFDLIKAIFICFVIFFVTYIINIDFGTNFNSPYSILKDYVNISLGARYLLLIVLGLISSFVGYIINKLYLRRCL